MAGNCQLSGTGAEHFAPHADQSQGTAITDTVIYAVGVLA